MLGRFYITLTVLICGSAWAELTPLDLPYLAGTPFVQVAGDAPEWQLLQYDLDEHSALRWAWLASDLGDQAYIVFPQGDDSSAATFPNGQLIAAKADSVVIEIHASEPRELTFSALGGSIQVRGTFIQAVKPAIEPLATTTDVCFDLVDTRTITIGVAASAPAADGTALFISTDDAILSLAGNGSSDRLRGLTADSVWTLYGAGAGTYASEDAELLVAFSGMDLLIGGAGRDAFFLHTQLDISIDGGEGETYLTAPYYPVSEPQPAVPPRCGSEDSGAVLSAQETLGTSEEGLCLSENGRIVEAVDLSDMPPAKIVFQDAEHPLPVVMTPIEPLNTNSPPPRKSSNSRGGAGGSLLLGWLCILGLVTSRKHT